MHVFMWWMYGCTYGWKDSILPCQRRIQHEARCEGNIISPFLSGLTVRSVNRKKWIRCFVLMCCMFYCFVCRVCVCRRGGRGDDGVKQGMECQYKNKWGFFGAKKRETVELMSKFGLMIESAVFQWYFDTFSLMLVKLVRWWIRMEKIKHVAILCSACNQTLHTRRCHNIIEIVFKYI